MEEVKQKSKTNERGKTNYDFYLSIYHIIKKGGKLSQICKEKGVKKQNLNYYVKILKQKNIIERVSKTNVYLGWRTLVELTDEELIEKVKQKNERGKTKSSLGTSERPKTNLHALQIKFPILSGKIQDKEWQIKENLKNWIPKYTTLSELGGLTIKNNNNKSLTVWANQRNIRNLPEIDNLAYKIRNYIYIYFKNKHNVIIDHMNAEVKNLDIATEDKNAESMRRKGEKFELDLKKKSEKIFNKDNFNAKAWIDGTPYNFSAESNDKEWKRQYLEMPFNIRNLTYLLQNIEKYNNNIELHTKVQNEQLKTQKELQKLIHELKQQLTGEKQCKE